MGILKLQMNLTIDGFVGTLDHKMDGMSSEVDDRQIKYLQGLNTNVDAIIMGRQMATESIPHWENLAASGDENPEIEFARFFRETQKIIFSKTLKSFEGENISVENRPLREALSQLKTNIKNDIIVYGGARFVSSLIEENLIDQLNLFIHPVSFGKGLTIFNGKSQFELMKAESYSNGIILHQYKALRM